MARLQRVTAPPPSSDSKEKNVFKPYLENFVQAHSVSTFTELEDLMILDQFLCIFSVEVQQFVLDRESKTAGQAAQIADACTANRMPVYRKGQTPTEITKEHHTRGSTEYTKSGESLYFGNPNANMDCGATRRCFSCNQEGRLPRTEGTNTLYSR